MEGLGGRGGAKCRPGCVSVFTGNLSAGLTESLQNCQSVSAAETLKARGTVSMNSVKAKVGDHSISDKGG